MFCAFGIMFKIFLPILGFHIYQHYIIFLLYSFLTIKIPSV